MRHLLAVAAALVAAAGAAAGAGALEGAFTTAGGGVTFTFADGVISGVTPDGVAVADSYVIEGDTITITAPAEHPACPGAVGVYTFVETDTDVTFTLVSDECEPRAAGFTAEPWIKAAE